MDSNIDLRTNEERGYPLYESNFKQLWLKKDIFMKKIWFYLDLEDQYNVYASFAFTKDRKILHKVHGYGPHLDLKKENCTWINFRDLCRCCWIRRSNSHLIVGQINKAIWCTYCEKSICRKCFKETRKVGCTVGWSKKPETREISICNKCWNKETSIDDRNLNQIWFDNGKKRKIEN